MIPAASDISSPVGVIAGGGAMPFAVADSLSRRGIAPVLFALRGACDPVRVGRFRHHWISVGQLGRATKLFRSEGCRDLIFIGTLLRPALSEIRLDWGTIRVLGRVWAAFRGGDDHLLSGIGRILEQDGFRMVGIRDVAPDILMPEGNIARAARLILFTSRSGSTEMTPVGILSRMISIYRRRASSSRASRPEPRRPSPGGSARGHGPASHSRRCRPSWP